MTYKLLTVRSGLHLCLCLLLISALAAKAQDAAILYRSSVFRDGNRAEEAKQVIRKATADKQVDVLIDAVHGVDPDVFNLALDGIGSLPKPQQARVLAKLLLDNNLISYGDDLPPMGDMGMHFMQTALQNRIEQLAYSVLGGKPPARDGWLTRSQAAALAAKLKAVD